MAVTAGDRNFVLYEKARRHFWAGSGALSIKTFSGGKALYESGTGRYEVDDGTYLVLNQDQAYSVLLDSDAAMESFCVFFRDGLVEDVARNLTTRTDDLLWRPDRTPRERLRFFERTYPHDDTLTPGLAVLREALPGRPHDPAWLEEALHDVAERLLVVHGRARREADALGAARLATREELYRRLHRARDYVAASLAGPVTLAELARVACLSPNHLLRSFRRLFGRSPHQYLTDLRLERARRLLERSDAPVTDVALAVGFESLGSFSWLFSRRLGVSPHAWRQAKKVRSEKPPGRRHRTIGWRGDSR